MWYDSFVAPFYTLVACSLTIDPVYSVTLSVSNLVKSLGMFHTHVLHCTLPQPCSVLSPSRVVHTESEILPRVLAWTAGNDCSFPG